MLLVNVEDGEKAGQRASHNSAVLQINTSAYMQNNVNMLALMEAHFCQIKKKNVKFLKSIPSHNNEMKN